MSFQQPLGIWCLRNNRNDANHSTVVLAFARRTTCLNIQQNNLIQIHLGLEENERTLCIGRLHDDSLVQITISKIRHIRKDNTKDIPFTNKATKAVMTDYGKQIAVALSGAYVVYY